MSVYITGDTHGGEDARALRIWHRQHKEQLTKDDYLIIAGDCGVYWVQDSKAEFREYMNQLACVSIPVWQIIDF